LVAKGKSPNLLTDMKYWLPSVLHRIGELCKVDTNTETWTVPVFDKTRKRWVEIGPGQKIKVQHGERIIIRAGVMSDKDVAHEVELHTSISLFTTLPSQHVGISIQDTIQTPTKKEQTATQVIEIASDSDNDVIQEIEPLTWTHSAVSGVSAVSGFSADSGHSAGSDWPGQNALFVDVAAALAAYHLKRCKNPNKSPAQVFRTLFPGRKFSERTLRRYYSMWKGLQNELNAWAAAHPGGTWLHWVREHK
jgi:hypothetical protein